MRTAGAYYWIPSRLKIVQDILLHPTSTSWQKVAIKCAKRGIIIESRPLSVIGNVHKLKKPYIKRGGHRWGIRRTPKVLRTIKGIVAKAESWNNAEDMCVRNGIDAPYYVIQNITYKYKMAHPKIRVGRKKYYT